MNTLTPPRPRRSMFALLGAVAGVLALLVIPAAAAGAATVVVGVSAPSSAEVGTAIDISVSYSCSGDEDCENVSIVLAASGALGDDSVTCDLGTVPTGSSSGLATCSLPLSFPGDTPNGATGTVTASASLSNGAGNSVQRTITAVNSGGNGTTTTQAPQTTTTAGPTTTTPPAPAPSIWIDKSKSDGSLYPGQVYEFTFRVRNTGDYALDNVVITDSLPVEFLYSSPAASNGGTAELVANSLTFSWDSLAVGAEVTATVQATVVYPAPS